MLTKQHALASVKFAKDSDGNPTGEVTALVSMFGNVDSVGDRVVKGAFARTIKSWQDSGDPIPMLWSHDWSNPMSHIGAWDASKAVETDEGLQLTGHVFVNEGNPVADQAFKLLKARLVREFSFAYDVEAEQPAKDGANELLDLTLIEAGPCLKGANSETRLVEAKAQMAEALAEGRVKAGRVLSAKNEGTLSEALDHVSNGAAAIKSVLAALQTEDGKARKSDDGEPQDQADEPTDEAKANEPTDLETLAELLGKAAELVGSMVKGNEPDEAKDDAAEEPAADEADEAKTDEPEPVVTPKNSPAHDDVLARLAAADSFASLEYRSTDR